jgi:hypothetical protein
MGEVVCVYWGFRNETYRPTTKIEVLPANEVVPFLDEFSITSLVQNYLCV